MRNHLQSAQYVARRLAYFSLSHKPWPALQCHGLTVITGTEDRQHAYVALTRGTDVNTAYVFTASPKTADPVPGPRPAPELARYDRRAAAPGAAPGRAARHEALAVLAGVLDRDGQLLAATQTRDQALADADHLAILHAIWAAETGPARDQRYRDLLLGALPPGSRSQPGHQARWLWRALRAAELAGLDPAQALADAIAERDLAGSRDIAAVLDARLRHRAGALVPLAPRPWSAQVPALADPARQAYVTEIAALMDARKDRIGEHAAAHPQPWAIGQPGEMDQWITGMAAGHRTFADRLADRQSQTIPSQDPDYGDLGPAFPAWTGPGREPILQPPRPEIPPSPQILQRAMDRDAGWEAAD